MALELDLVLLDTDSGSPEATRICSWIRSTFVIISLTGCSTWMRAFISMNAKLPSWSSRNSIVPAPVYPIESAPSTAFSPMSLRISGVRWIDGASSISFWWRRWTEQSRSPK